jgi:uroporphyrin-III C-methyltransferase
MEKRYTLPGKVYLTGAGPGSAKLLTLRALEALWTADIVLHDDLVSEEVLAQVPAHVGVFNVGKRCGAKKVTQNEINQRMIAAARNGQTVVRLKGGDPLIFARTRDEIEGLREAGIEFEIIPGITAATAAAAMAQIPLTDRRKASKLVLLTNHHTPDKEARDWHTSLTADATLVFYMPGGDFEGLRSALVENGLSEDTTCLLVSQATRPGQKVIRTTVGDLMKAPAVAAPSLLIVAAAAANARADEVAISETADEGLSSDRYEEISLDLPQPDEMTASYLRERHRQNFVGR